MPIRIETATEQNFPERVPRIHREAKFCSLAVLHLRYAFTVQSAKASPERSGVDGDNQVSEDA